MQSVLQPMKSVPVPQYGFHSGRNIYSIRLICGIVFLLIVLSRSLVSLTDLWHQPNYHSLSSHCAGINPISSPEYHIRQTNLAKTLHTLNASAYIAEPSASSQFFANFSTAQWFLSERPLLLILTPSVNPIDGAVEAKITILTPKVKSSHQ